MTTPTVLGPTTMRGVNDLIWESLDHGGHTDLVAFFCECGQEGCYRPVWLTPVEYEQNRRWSDWAAVAASHG